MNVQLHRGGKVHKPHANGHKLPACATGRDQASVLSASNERRYRWTKAVANCTKCENLARAGDFVVATRSKADRDFYRNLVERKYATDRAEHEPCERGTAGCSIDHARDTHDECATW